MPTPTSASTPVPEHRIKLRAGWECHHREPDDDSDPAAVDVARKVDLPAASGRELPPRRFRLTRHFGKPPVDPGVEVVALEIRSVSGLRAIRLNGLALAPPAAGPSWSIDLDPARLLPRNGLVLEFDRSGADLDVSPWGDVALVIRPR